MIKPIVEAKKIWVKVGLLLSSEEMTKKHVNKFEDEDGKEKKKKIICLNA